MNHQYIYPVLALAWVLLLANCKQDPSASGNSPAPQPPAQANQQSTPPPNPEDSIKSVPINKVEDGSSKEDNQPLFSLLDPAQTGITFTNPILNTHPRNYLYASSFSCGGVSVGDINGDSLPDLFFTGGPVPNRLYVQTEKLVFKDVTATAGVSGEHAWGTGSSIVDIDNDGDLDIYVCNYDSPNSL